MIRVEINQIISGLEKHQVHRVVTTKLRPFIPISRESNVQTIRQSEDDDFKLSSAFQSSNRTYKTSS
jgi:hypothetical protein